VASPPPEQILDEASSWARIQVDGKCLDNDHIRAKLDLSDRDIAAVHNIWTIWLGDNVKGFARPAPFVRPSKKKSK
jgi:hypothetical protein